MIASTRQRPVHLVGSVPLANAEAVFRTASAILGERVKRLPDGETGVRTGWIRWQRAVFARTSGLEPVPVGGDDFRGPEPLYRPTSHVALRPGVTASEIAFDDLGYADAALASYETFARLKAEGAIPPATRFLVCLPTPLAPVTVFVAPASRAAVEPAYEAQLLAEVARICAAIPHDQLAIQWDTAVEFGILEGVWPTHLADPPREIVDRLVRLGERVPDDVELGYHLCYGEAGHRHFVQPRDAGRLVEVANGICAGVGRPVHWIHLPVPRDRDDAAYYAPLGNLALHPETELYLGLVHLTDGVAGTRRRMAAAARVVEGFGIATECGLGQRPAETVEPLLAVHRDAADGASGATDERDDRAAFLVKHGGR
jgi:hypothetical protein